MPSFDTYKTIVNPSEALYKEKGSRFISLAIPVSTEEEAKSRIADVKKQYFDATHHCYAWAIGPTRELQRINDNGEPSGTAGKPIFGQILSYDLTNILLVVIRYFGGIKLGASGLSKAYKTAAQLALSAAEIRNVTMQDTFKIVFEYTNMNEVMNLFKEENLIPEQFVHADRCQIIFSVRKNIANHVSQKLRLIKNMTISNL